MDRVGAQPSVDEQVRAGVVSVIDSLYGENIAVEDLDGHLMGGLPFGGVELPSEFDEPYIAGVDYVENDIIWNIDEALDKTLLGTAWVAAHVNVETYVFKGAITHLEDLEIVDADWNDHMVLARYSVEVQLNFELQWEHGVHDSMSVQMVGAEPIPVPEHGAGSRS